MAARRSHGDPVDVLAHAAFVVMAVLTRVAAQHDMSLTQLRVFGILRDHRPRMAELAEFLGLERSTMSGLIGRAEQRGIVRRVPNPDDARATDVVMTPAGHALAAVVQAQIRGELEPLIARLDPDERDALAGLLSHVVSAAEPAPGG